LACLLEYFYTLYFCYYKTFILVQYALVKPKVAGVENDEDLPEEPT